MNLAGIPAGSRAIYGYVLPTLGWSEVDSRVDADLYCVVTHAGLEAVISRLYGTQRVNRFPGMISACEKVNFARLVNPLMSVAPEVSNVFFF